MTARAAVLSLALVLTPPALASADGPMRVLVPGDNAVVTGGGLVSIVVEIDAGVPPTDVRVRMNGTDLRPGQPHARPDGRTVVHWTVQLALGPSTVDVTLGDPHEPRARARRALFFHDAILARDDPRRDTTPAPFHTTANERACRDCHRMDPAFADAAPGVPERSTCHGCHRGITDVRAVHGPAALWACTKCHDPLTTPARYATPRPVMPLCFGCHEEQKESFWNNPYRHGPTATGFCTICHDPHGSEHGFFLKKAAWDLCTTCHAEKATGRHVVSWGPTGQTHPTRGRPDPVRPGRELSCASCHNPHAAPGAKLWNFGVTKWGELCTKCHRSLVGG